MCHREAETHDKLRNRTSFVRQAGRILYRETEGRGGHHSDPRRVDMELFRKRTIRRRRHWELGEKRPELRVVITTHTQPRLRLYARPPALCTLTCMAVSARRNGEPCGRLLSLLQGSTPRWSPSCAGCPVIIAQCRAIAPLQCAHRARLRDHQASPHPIRPTRPLSPGIGQA